MNTLYMYSQSILWFLHVIEVDIVSTVVSTLFLHLGRVKRCTVDVETAPLNASQTRASIQQ